VPPNVRRTPILLSIFPCRPVSDVRYMLDAIGAGATAKTKQNWGKIWSDSEECTRITEEIEKIASERKNTEMSKFMKDQREYAMPMSTQIMAVTKRSFTSYWRDPDYLLGKYSILRPHWLTQVFLTYCHWSIQYIYFLDVGKQYGGYAKPTFLHFYHPHHLPPANPTTSTPIH
jgi:hypothetical protein